MAARSASFGEIMISSLPSSERPTISIVILCSETVMVHDKESCLVVSSLSWVQRR